MRKNNTLKIKNFGESSKQSFCDFFFLRKNKRAQISEIMTWVIATIIILFILLLFVYSASLFAQKTKTIKAKTLTADLDKDVDLIETKNSITYAIASEEEKQIIDEWRDENEENE